MVLEANTLVRDKYRITRLIGDGGMGAVYEAQHLVLKVPVALKFLHSDLAERPGLADRFLREARVSASIQSPHVTRVTDVDTTEAGTPFLVMELLRGESLQELLDREVQLPESTVIDYGLQILSGLEAAHALNVVHRDLKPDNVFITKGPGGPVLKLIDFGIAKLRSTEEFKQTLTRAGSMMGTPEYMAPEQLYAAEDVDARADLFSLGVMLYEMLCGKRPVEGDDATEIVSRFVARNIVPLKERLPSVNDALAAVVHRALEPEREARFDSAFAMRMALAPLATTLSHAGQLAATPAPLPVNPSSEVDEPDPSTRRTSVADTLPPDSAKPDTTEDDPVLPAAGGTQLRPNAPAMAPPASPIAQQAAREFKVRPAGVPVPTARPARTRTRNALIATLVVLLVLIGAAIVVLVVLDGRRSQPPQELPALVSPPPGTIEPETVPDAGTVTPTPTAAAPDRPKPPEPPVARPGTPRPQPSAKPSTPDAGPIFPFPSTLPPLPSSLPPLPSGFPTALPSFFPPIPGLTPPPAPEPDAGQ